MKLSEQLKRDHEGGDFGLALSGYSERARELEDLLELCAKDHVIGSDERNAVIDECINKIKSCELVAPHIKRIRLDEAVGSLIGLKNK